MNNTNIAKKPFGLTVAVKVAQEALKDNIAPTSVVLSNLFYLQKSKIFPKELDKLFFGNTKYQADDLEKKTILKLLDSFKRPQVNIQELLEGVLIEGWIPKVAPKPVNKAASFKPKTQKKSPKANKPKMEATAPTIIVKKAKLS